MIKSYFKRTKAEILQDILSIFLIVVGLYILFLPLIPEIKYRLNTPNTKHQFVSVLSEQYLFPIPKENMLIIPQIKVTAEIHEGQSEETLMDGIWRRPNTSTPAQGGNTVLTAHRFLYQDGPNTFYHLDKLKKDDQFTIYWDQKKYHYQVTETFEVTPEEVEIERNTAEPIITLYTCTPLWTSKNRLVVRAKKI